MVIFREIVQNVQKMLLFLPFRGRVIHSLATSGHDKTLTANVKSMEYSFLKEGSMTFSVTAGPCDRTLFLHMK